MYQGKTDAAIVPLTGRLAVNLKENDMGGISIWQLAIVGILVVLLFGRGKISELMGDVAKGIKSFKKGMKDDEIDGAVEAKVDAEQKISSPDPEPIDITPKKEGEKA